MEVAGELVHHLRNATRKETYTRRDQCRSRSSHRSSRRIREVGVGESAARGVVLVANADDDQRLWVEVGETETCGGEKGKIG
jgi:hypothetical protein